MLCLLSHMSNSYRDRCRYIYSTEPWLHGLCYNTRTILTHAHRASLIDGLGRPAGQVVHYSTVVAISHRGLRPASCVIVSGFRAALDYYISP